LPLARIIAAGPPADSGITLAAWPSWYECEFFACHRRGTTCADPKCKIGSACLAMREIGLDGNGGPLRRRERPKCGARNRQGEPCAVRVEPGKARCRFHGGLSTGPRTIEGRARVANRQLRPTISLADQTPLRGRLSGERAALQSRAACSQQLDHVPETPALASHLLPNPSIATDFGSSVFSSS
jgi:hypothetical protein